MDARLILGLFAAALPLPRHRASVDDQQAWDALLKKHVVLFDGGKASQLRYAGLAQDRAALKAYLDAVEGDGEEFKRWPREQRLAFLINAYNAFTVEKILTRYPEIEVDLGFRQALRQPVQGRVLRLLGRELAST